MLIGKNGRVNDNSKRYPIYTDAIKIRAFDSDCNVAAYREVGVATHVARNGSEVRVSHAIESTERSTQTVVWIAPPLEALDSKALKGGTLTPMGTQYPLKYSTETDVDQVPVKNDAVGTAEHPLCIAIDAEWTTDDANDKARKILTVQFACRDSRGVLRFAIVDVPIRQAFETVLAYVLDDWTRMGVIHDPSISKREMAKLDALRKAAKEGRGEKPKIPYFHIELVAHYGLIDITTFRNGQALLRNSDTVRKTQVSLAMPYFGRMWVSHATRVIPAMINFRDTMLLAPTGSGSLAALGDALKFNKLKLPSGAIEQMDVYYRDHYDSYYCYALRDVHVTLLWKEKVGGVNMNSPITIGSQAAQLLRAGISNARGWDVKAFDFYWRGIDTIVEGTGEHRKTRKEMRPEAAAVQSAATHAYYGGRNECFLFGIQHAQAGWSDFDLSGAYPTAMCLVPDIDFAAPVGTLAGRLTRGQITPMLLTFPLVDFEFPDDTRMPCLPVHDDEGRGLIYPLRGRAYASAPELYLALELGCKIDVVSPTPIMQPAHNPANTREVIHSMRDGVLSMVRERARVRKLYGKGSVEELLAKERVNTGYGKTAQGLRDKRSYSTRDDDYHRSVPSVVTNPYAAAMTTSYVRAIVSAALVQLDGLGYKIASVTTDGFLTDAPLDVLDNLPLFGFAGLFRDARNFLSGDPTIWELKHKALSLVMLKTRGGFGIGQIGAAKLPEAKAGLKPTDDMWQTVKAATELGEDPKVAMNNALARTYLTRESGHIAYLSKALPSPKEYVRNAADGISKNVNRSANWEGDQKRQSVTETAVNENIIIDGKVYQHVSFETRPWPDMAAFKNARSVSEKTQRAVKTVTDLREIEARIAYRAAKPEGARASRHGAAYTQARDIVRAVRQGVLQYDGTGRSLLDRLEDRFHIDLPNTVWKKAPVGKFTLDGLDSTIADLGLTRIQ